MSDDRGDIQQTEDSSIRDNAGPVVILKNEYPRGSAWKEPAVYIAILALIVSVGGEVVRWTNTDDHIKSVKAQERSYLNEINVWEIDTFNRDKDIEEYLKEHYALYVSAKFGKRKMPPVPPED